MDEELSEEKIKDLMKIKGGARGIHFKVDREYVLKEKGKQGLKELEAELARLGCPIDYQRISGLDFYPAGLRAVSLLAIKKVFGWDNKDVKNLCSYAVGASLLVKIYMKYFYSIPKVIEQVPKIWADYFNFGKLVAEDYDPDKGQVYLKVEDFSLDPVYCRCLESFFATIGKLVVGAGLEVECRETNCTFSGDNYHKFLLSWHKKV